MNPDQTDLELSSISQTEIWTSDPILNFISARIGLDRRKKIAHLFLLITIPFLLTAAASISENRFKPGSVTAKKQIAVLTPDQYHELSEAFTAVRLTSRSFRGLRRMNVPEDILTRLQPMKSEIFLSVKGLMDTVGKHIGTRAADQYRSAIVDQLEKKHLLKNVKTANVVDSGAQSSQTNGDLQYYINMRAHYLDRQLLLKDLPENRAQELRAAVNKYLRHSQMVQTMEVIGMSFIGDTMVWPFFILVPWAILLLAKSVRRMERFFDGIRRSIDLSVSNQRYATYESILARTKESLAGKNIWRWCKWTGFTAGLVFIVWNTIICTNPQSTHIYSADRVFVIMDGERQEIDLLNAVDLPKWDTDYQMGRYSWATARLWVIFGYGLVPIILAKLINLIGSLFGFCKGIARHDLLRIKPLATDKTGGFSILSETAISFVYVMVPFLVMLLASFFKEATPPSGHNYLLIILFLPVLSTVFFPPIISFRRAVKMAKKSYLQKIADQYNRRNEELLNDLNQGTQDPKEIEGQSKQLDILKNMHKQVSGIPEWPMELATMYRFLGSFSLPPAIGAVLKYLSKFMRT